MGRFLALTKRKVALAVALLLGCFGLFLLRLIPVEVDLLNLRKLPRIVATVLVRWPIQIFDTLTQRHFAPRGESFIVFPTLPQTLFALAFDWATVYLLACTITALRSKNTATG